MTGLRIEKMSVTLGGAQILNKVNFSVGQGEVVGLIGPNGAGKSTAIKAALGLVEMQEGVVRDNVTDVDFMAPRERAMIMSYVPQGAPVHWPLTAERTAALGRVPHLNPWQDMSAADHAAVQTAMEKTDCWSFRDRLVTTLSGGERSRVLLARTLAVGARYILADEPTASLDPMHQLQVMDILRAEAAAGAGVLVVMHDLGQAHRYCDRLVMLDGGKLIAEGAPADVLTDANLKSAFGVEVARWQEGGQEFLAASRVVE
jgi:iron complex transport system ATP-binding protein